MTGAGGGTDARPYPGPEATSTGTADPADGIRVAIDGPAASGKSTTAHAVAERLGYVHLNSGQLYRAVAWASLQGGWADRGTDDGERRGAVGTADANGPGTPGALAPARVEEGLEDLELELVPRPPGHGVRVNGREVSPELQDREVTRRASELATMAPVRRRVRRLLRSAGRGGGVVCDGRDIGTVVFPEAELKIFLVADPEERARRRLLDHGEEPTPRRVREEAARLRERDEADTRRELAPLRRAPDAVLIDTTEMTPEEVVARIVDLVRRRERGSESSRG